MGKVTGLVKPASPVPSPQERYSPLTGSFAFTTNYPLLSTNYPLLSTKGPGLLKATKRYPGIYPKGYPGT
jgi:hypothetical protein